MKLLLGILICLVFSCAVSNVTVVKIKATDSYFIDIWKKNGVKILKIDTLSNGLLKVYTK